MSLVRKYWKKRVQQNKCFVAYISYLEGGTVACVTSSQEALVKSAGKKGNEQEDIAEGPPIKDVDILGKMT